MRTGDGWSGWSFFLVMLGFLVQWPTLLTLIMFPVLTAMYVKLAKTEERQAQTEFGTAYAEYAKDVPAFVPGIDRLFDRSRRDH